jgi:hypothetical protein
MLRLASMAVTAALLLGPDISGVLPLRPATETRVEFPPGTDLPVLPDMSPAKDQDQSTQGKAAPSNAPPANPASVSAPAKSGPLKPDTQLILIRYLDGEFVRVLQPLPGGKGGFHIKAGSPIDQKALQSMLFTVGAAVNPGDQAQVTRIEFKERQIVVDINGGGRGKKPIKDRIHLEVGIPGAQTVDPVPTASTPIGATLFLDFDQPLQEMTPDQLKLYLSGLLDFTKQHSAAVQWVQTLPPDMQKAIADRRAVTGMDREMVLAAIGKPDRKVREKTDDGDETEDWIYGKPPSKTIFVKFEGDKVIEVEQFPQ